jgi:S-DNA-T family DNA segregation ATPase FtsK/SpoIIIE
MLWRKAMHARRVRRYRHARARQIAQKIERELHRMHDMRYRITHGKHKDTIKVIRLKEPVLLTRDEVFCPIDSAHLPPNVKTPDLEKPDVLKSLSDRIGSTVRLVRLSNGQISYTTRLQGSTFPAVFPYNAYKMPGKAPLLAIPLGLNADGEHAWVDLVKLPHLLVIGPTGKGKSTLLHTVLTTWIERNNPDELELWLADHKGGAELNRYTALMPKRGQHTGIVQRFSFKPETTLEFLEAARKEMKRRLELMRQQDTSDINDYEKVTGVGFRRLVVVIDEIVNLMLNKEKVDRYTIGKHAESIMVELASQGRAAGVHLVISTQVIKSDVLTSLIKANFESRICFGVADHWQSLTAIDDSRAEGLPVGRIILKREGEYSEYQSPLITAHQTRLIIDRIARYGPDGGLGEANEANRFRDDAMLLVKVAAEHFEGVFKQREIREHPQIKGVIACTRVEEIARKLQQDGVLLAGKPKHPRRLAPLIMKNTNIIMTMYGVTSQGETARHIKPISKHIEPYQEHIKPYQESLDMKDKPQQDGQKPGKDMIYEMKRVITFPGNQRIDSENDKAAEGDQADDPPPPSWWGKLGDEA